jgi:hypothetical protein
MQLCIFYLLTVRRQENKVFSAAFAENTSFPAGGSKYTNSNRKKHEGRIERN